MKIQRRLLAAAVSAAGARIDNVEVVVPAAGEAVGVVSTGGGIVAVGDAVGELVADFSVVTGHSTSNGGTGSVHGGELL